VGLLALSMASLPILPDAAWKPGPAAEPLGRILLLLLVSVGPAYGMLSTTGPLLQAWFARERPGSVPYRLFALSNFGSMLALLGYPFGFEPLMPVRAQSLAFSVGYVVFAIACSVLALRAFRKLPNFTWNAWSPAATPASQRMHWGTLLEWGTWAALASALLLALTSDLTQNVAPIPLLWVLPLAIYLLSFILCFEGRAWYRRGWFLPAALAGLLGLAWGLLPQPDHMYVPLSIALHCGALFAICMVCHGELARKKPDPRHLTTFYLMVAVGGVAGGLFAGLVAPYAFRGDWEFPIVLVASAGMIAWSVLRDPVLELWPIAQGNAAPQALARLRAWRPIQSVAVGAAALGVLALAGYATYQVLDDAKLLVRNFYGTLRIEEREEDSPLNHVRMLFHGTIIHGYQFLNGEWRRRPTSYFTAGSGVGVGIRATQSGAPQRVGVVGLGAGTLAAYARKGDHLTFYEINALVEHLARTQFFYLADAPGTVDVRLGDARLVLEREAPQGYDTFVVDAFSGDAIPIHLLTLEAFELYFRHLKPDGILAVHVSNKRLNLAPIVAMAADTLHKHAWIMDSEDDDDENAYGSTWVLVADRPDRLSDIEVPAETRELTRPADLRPWTDDYSSLFHILR
jgi:SAM-dependent methyltransferase